ncbi:hypothetical protein CPJ18_23425 [Agrobacterium rosae]|uniref:Uncharacterized protein n=1 Tax=Agrobacterium rosae TaxID=1972867 RepID=A0AAE5RTE9_9HYPH|nr:hypothetical protein DXM21_22230 [Agrobacterium rosae]POO48923.1 hypothetical protein CPJ18_23425 [Agrobacterium rosae]
MVTAKHQSLWKINNRLPSKLGRPDDGGLVGARCAVIKKTSHQTPMQNMRPSSSRFGEHSCISGVLDRGLLILSLFNVQHRAQPDAPARDLGNIRSRQGDDTQGAVITVELWISVTAC